MPNGTSGGVGGRGRKAPAYPIIAKSCAVEDEVRKDDFEKLALGGVIGRNPLFDKGLREFENPDGQFGLFAAITVCGFDAKRCGRNLVAEFR